MQFTCCHFFPIVLFIEKQLLARRSNEDVSLDSPFLLIQGIFFLRPIIIWLCCFWHPYATVLENEAFKLLGCHNTMRRAVEVIRSLIDAIHFTFSACSLSCLRHDLFFFQFDCSFSSIVTGTSYRLCWKISSAFPVRCWYFMHALFAPYFCSLAEKLQDWLRQIII